MSVMYSLGVLCLIADLKRIRRLCRRSIQSRNTGTATSILLTSSQNDVFNPCAKYRADVSQCRDAAQSCTDQNPSFKACNDVDIASFLCPKTCGCCDYVTSFTHAASPSSDTTTAVTFSALETTTGTHTTQIQITSPKLGHWSEWFSGKCSATCGFGTQHRLRVCNTGDCIGPSSDSIPCNDKNCTTQASWSEWAYGACSKTCGEGHVQKLRICSTGNALDCLGSHSETVTCNVQVCTG